MKYLVLIMASLILWVGWVWGQKITPDQAQCYTLSRLNELAALSILQDGMSACCSDCNFGTCPCTDGGPGALAVLSEGDWKCVGCGPGPTVTTTTLPPLVAGIMLPGQSIQANTDKGWPGGFHSNTGSSGGGVVCARMTIPVGIQDATKIAIRNASGAGGMRCGVAIYPDGDFSPYIARTSFLCDTASVLSATVSAFTMIAGNTYRVCSCGSIYGGSGSRLVSLFTGNPYVYDFANSRTISRGAASTDCNTAGEPPTVTGQLANTVPPLGGYFDEGPTMVWVSK